MEKEKKQLGVAFIVVLVAIVMVSAIGIIAMSNKPVVLQGQIEATEIRISGKLPGRIDTFLVREGQYVKMGDTLVVINSPEAWAKFQQVNALEDIAKFQNKKIDDGTRRQIVRSVEELWNKSKSDLQLATVTYDRIQALYKDSVVTSQRKDEVEAMYKAAVAAERAAHQQFLLVKDGAQKEDKESARSLVDAARGTVNEVQALLMDARLTAPEDGQISTIYPKRGELVGAGTPIMSLVVLDDCHVVLNVREDYMPYFRMNENFMGDIPALDVKNKAFKINYISPLGSFATWRSTKQTGTYDMKTFEIHALPVEPMEGLRPGMSVLVNLQGAFRDAEDAANLLTGQVQFISDGRAVRVDQNIDGTDGFDDVAAQFLERGAVAGNDLFGHATGFLSGAFPEVAGCRRPGTILYSPRPYRG